MWSSDQQHQHQGTCWKCGVSGFTPDLWNNSVNLQEIHMHTNKKHLFTLLLLLTAPTLPHFSFCSRHWVVRPLSVLFNLVNVSSLPFWHGESGSDKAKGNFMDHSLKVQAKLCPTEPWKDRNFFFFFFWEHLQWSFWWFITSLPLAFLVALLDCWQWTILRLLWNLLVFVYGAQLKCLKL